MGKVKISKKPIDKQRPYDIFGTCMKKTAHKVLKKQDSAAASSALYLSFCRALDKYCEQIGVNSRRFSAVRILHDAACNTLAGMHIVTIAQRRHMARMERDIPQMFDALIEISATDGMLHTVERMSAMSLAQVSSAVAEKSRKR